MNITHQQNRLDLHSQRPEPLLEIALIISGLLLALAATVAAVNILWF